MRFSLSACDVFFSLSVSLCFCISQESWLQVTENLTQSGWRKEECMGCPPPGEPRCTDNLLAPRLLCGLRPQDTLLSHGAHQLWSTSSQIPTERKRKCMHVCTYTHLFTTTNTTTPKNLKPSSCRDMCLCPNQPLRSRGTGVVIAQASVKFIWVERLHVDLKVRQCRGLGSLSAKRGATDASAQQSFTHMGTTLPSCECP